MEPNLNKYKTWLAFLKKVRLFLEKEGLIEVVTPTLVPSGAMEAQLDAFQVSKTEFLPTSPEFALKKLWLSGEFDTIFEISPSFRDNEMGEKHLSEFTMLEFYIAGGEISDLKTIVKELFKELSSGSLVSWGEVCLAELFRAATGFDLEPTSDKLLLKKVCLFHDISFGEDYSWNDLYQLIFINLMEPLFSSQTPLFVTNYPPQIAALAKINKEGWADRVEIFYKGCEIGNGYNELFDSEELLKRWNKENAERLVVNKQAHPVDQGLVESHKQTKLKQGVGIAIGLERLFLVLESGEDESIIKWPF